jgi:hypothetical protein
MANVKAGSPALRRVSPAATNLVTWPEPAGAVVQLTIR